MPFAVSPDDAVRRAERRLAALEELTELGMALARRMVTRDADRAEAGAGGGDPGLAFSRIARAVRMTVALADRLEQPVEVRWPQKPVARQVAAGTLAAGCSSPGESAEDKARMQAGMRGVILSATISNVVEEAIEAEVDGDIGGPEAERLLSGLYERLEDDDEVEAIGRRTIGESVALICRDLGLTPDWGVWEFEHWAIAEAKGKAEGSPYGRPRRVPVPRWSAGLEAGGPPGGAQEIEVLDSAFGSP